MQEMGLVNLFCGHNMFRKTIVTAEHVGMRCIKCGKLYWTNESTEVKE